MVFFLNVFVLGVRENKSPPYGRNRQYPKQRSTPKPINLGLVQQTKTVSFGHPAHVSENNTTGSYVRLLIGGSRRRIKIQTNRYALHGTSSKPIRH